MSHEEPPAGNAGSGAAVSSPWHSAEGTVTGMFAKQAARLAGAVAVEHGERRVTYGELDRAANQLARLLGGPAGPDETVVLLFDRSIEMIVALLAVMKSGRAYVPLDSRHPPRRLAGLLEASGARAVLTDLESRALAIAGGRRVVTVNAQQAPHEGLDGSDPGIAVGPRDLAYVIFTSGSTGVPKGVAVEHAGLCNLARDQIRRWGTGPGSRVLQFAPLSFDASFTEIAVALLSGATLCLADQDQLMPGDELAATLRRLRITAVKTTPAALAMTSAEALPDLETVVNGGGVCRPDVVARWSPGRTFLNAYGVTECSVCSTMTGPLSPTSTITIGRPLDGTTAYVLDDHGRRVEPGEVGELCIGGAGVARGYWRQPELTTERFVPDPFGEPGSRLYRTGDLVRALPDGDVAYVGRLDDQVKIRGHRIEPGEVEATLASHPAIREVAVAAHRDAPGEEDRLVAYVVWRGGERSDATALRRHLADLLPSYLIPATFLELDGLPYTLRGKVDRAALSPASARRVDEGSAAEGGAPEPAESSQSRLLVTTVWEEALALDGIGPHDNFFLLGGDSLQAAVSLARLRELTGVRIPLRALLSAPTVVDMAAALDTLLAERAAAVAQGDASD